jgi:catechol 2,3-dioxygenase-like lactoylglutathione lyase family enzyme
MNPKQKRVIHPSSLGNLGIGHVGLRVADIEKSAEFYRNVLGLRVRSTDEGVARIPSGPDLIVLHGKEYAKSDFHFGFYVESPSIVDEWRDWFKTRGIRIEQYESEENYRSIKIRDPDGYWIEITCDKRQLETI